MTLNISEEFKQKLVVGFSASSRLGCSILMGTSIAVLIERGGGSPFHISLAMAAFFFGIGVFAPIWGAIADYTGKRKNVIIASSVLSTLSLIPLLIVQGIWTKIIIRGIYGAFVAGFLPPLLTIVSEKGGLKERGRSVGFFNSSRMAGGAMGQIFAGFVLGLLLPEEMFLILILVSVAATAATLLIKDPTPTKDRPLNIQKILKEVRLRIFPPRGEREHLNSHGLNWLYVSLGLRHLAIKGVGSVLPVYIITQVGVSELMMGIILALNPGFQTLFMYTSGHLADDVGRKPLIVIGIGGSVAYALLLATASIPESILFGGILAGASMILIAASFSAMNTGAIAFIGDVAPIDRESELHGLRSTVMGVGSAIGPILVGAMATIFSYKISFVIISLATFTGMIIANLKVTESRETNG